MPRIPKLREERRAVGAPPVYTVLAYLMLGCMAFLAADIYFTVTGFTGSKGRGETIVSELARGLTMLDRVERKLDCVAPAR